MKKAKKDGMNENELASYCKSSLEKKGVDFSKGVIDVSFARQLGNSSWGKIDFLAKYLRNFVIGVREYGKRNNGYEGG